MKPALLLLDLQMDFIDQVLEPHPEVLVEEVALLLRLFRGRSLPVVHLRTLVTLEPDIRISQWRQEKRDMSIDGTAGNEAPPEVEAVKDERVFRKSFFSAFSNPDFKPYLDGLAADTLILAGVHSHACVKQTALEAYARGFAVWVAGDAIGTYEPIQGAAAERYFARRGIKYLPTQEIEALLEGSRSNDTAKPPHGLPSALIAGREFPMRSEGWTHRSPANGAVLWTCAPVSTDLLDRALISALEVERNWGNTPMAERIEIFRRFAQKLKSNRKLLASMLVDEVGKPLSHAKGEVLATVSLVETVVKRAGQDVATGDSRWRRVPLGRIAVITPFNNPLMIPVGKLVPALIFGNTVVWKPSPYGSRIALEVARMLLQSGLPSPALGVILGGRQSGEALLRHPLVSGVALSGSLKAGYSARLVCAQRNLPLQAELGGNNAAICWGEDISWKDSITRIVQAAFGYAGQRCTATRRLIVPGKMLERTLATLVNVMRDYKVGHPAEPNVDCGPLISERHRRRVRQSIDLARRHQARHLVHPAAEPQEGYYVSPTVLWNVELYSNAVQEECFGPVLVVQEADDFGHALSLCNRVKQGLVASLFSNNKELQNEFLQKAQAGILKLNHSTSGAEPDVPFGGWKASGVGPPEHGPGDVAFFTRLQAVYS